MLSLFAFGAALLPLASSQGVTLGLNVAFISKEWNSVFPARDFNRNVSTAFWQVSFLDGIVNSTTQATLNQILNVSFIAYDKSFYQLLGISNYTQPKKLETIFTFPPAPSFATRQVHDGTVYSPEVNAIFFAELHVPKAGYSADAPTYLWRINLNDTANPVTEKVYPQPQLTQANGASYYNGQIYWAQEGNYTNPGGIVRMDPYTLQTAIVQNNFYAHRFSSPNDVVVTSRGVAYFSDGYYGQDNFNDSLTAVLANGIYRWDMNTGNINMVAGAADGSLFNPNGLALSPYEDKLYITNRGNTSDNPAGARTIYVCDLTTTGIRNKEIFAYSDASFADGIKTDREGRVYGGVLGAVDVYNSVGVLIGRIKVTNGDTAVNMVFVGNCLYIMGRDNVYRVQLEATAN